jgi:twinkle protein
MALYDDGHTHCFSCGNRTYDDTTPDRTRLHRKDRPRMDFLEGDYRDLSSRRLTEETCRKFGYFVSTDRSGRAVHVATYRNQEGEVVAQKIRDAAKNFSVIGDGKNMPLFGAHLFPGKGRRVVVTEGEIDAMSVCQAFGLKWPAVSIPNGAQSAKIAIANNLEWLSGYETVVLCFDMDEPGRKAAAECAALLPPGVAAIAELPLKDANEMLVARRTKELVDCLWQARAYRPDGIVSLDDIEDRVLVTPETGRPWPFPKLTAATFGRRLGELYGFGAGTGVGKTDLFTQIIAHDVLTLGVPCGVIYLEQGVGETGRRIAGKSVGKLFHVPDGSWTAEELAEAWATLKASGKLHLYDSWGAMSWDVIKTKIRYLVQALGCEHIFLDHMTALAAAEDDERKALERIMAEAASLCQELNCVIHYVSHLATPEGKPHEEGGRVMIRHFKGSRALGFWSHGMFGLERNQQGKPEERSITTLRCLKDRFTGRATGMCFPLQYNDRTGMLEEAGTAVFDEGVEDVDF